MDAEEDTGEILSMPPGERGIEHLWVTYPPAAVPHRETQVWLPSVGCRCAGGEGKAWWDSKGD